MLRHEEINALLQATDRHSDDRRGQGAIDDVRADGRCGIGFDFTAMVVLALTPADFYKSMTTHADRRVWQDVYRPMTVAGEIYLKLTVIDDVLIVSFKEL